jgi:hypothetical protein
VKCYIDNSVCLQSCIRNVNSGWGSVKSKTNRVLLDVEAGASDELPLIIKQSFKDGRYSPSTSMEEREWQIMLEQFIESGLVIKNEIINIDSDWIYLFCFCDAFLFESFGRYVPWHLHGRCILVTVTSSLTLLYYFCMTIYGIVRVAPLCDSTVQPSHHLCHNSSFV